MEACSFPESNHVFSRPEEMTDEQCTPLSVWVGEVAIGDPDSERVPAIVSCYKISQEELTALNEGKRLWLTIIGRSMPPVSVSLNSPFTP